MKTKLLTKQELRRRYRERIRGDSTYVPYILRVQAQKHCNERAIQHRADFYKRFHLLCRARAVASLYEVNQVKTHLASNGIRLKYYVYSIWYRLYGKDKYNL